MMATLSRKCVVQSISNNFVKPNLRLPVFLPSYLYFVSQRDAWIKTYFPEQNNTHITLTALLSLNNVEF